MKISGNIGKNRKMSENVGKNREKSGNRNFGGDILSISTENRNFADISTEISDILFPVDKAP